MSEMAAIGRPQFATGPQKCCKTMHFEVKRTYQCDWLYIIYFLTVLKRIYVPSECRGEKKEEKKDMLQSTRLNMVKINTLKDDYCYI